MISSRETGERELPKVRVFTLPCFLISPQCLVYGFPWWLTVRNPPAMQEVQETGDVSVPGSGRSPAGGLGNPLQYSCLENPMDRGTWRVTAHGVAKSRTQLKGLGMHTHFGL